VTKRCRTPSVLFEAIALEPFGGDRHGLEDSQLSHRLLAVALHLAQRDQERVHELLEVILEERHVQEVVLHHVGVRLVVGSVLTTVVCRVISGALLYMISINHILR
jgi:hypothetical protein